MTGAFQYHLQPVTVPATTAQFIPGGWIQLTGSSGTARSDVIPVMLSPGECVIPASVTAWGAIAQARQYIVQSYGAQAVTERGIIFRARPLTMAELMRGRQ